MTMTMMMMMIIIIIIRRKRRKAEKILKYKNFTIEIQLIWNVKAKVIPVIIGRLEPFQNRSDNT